jgi:predicted GH43/DUF377 family glycosyl hydrolase
MKHFSIVFVLVAVFVLVSTSIAQINWRKDPGNPIPLNGPNGTWYRHVFFPCVLYNPDSSRYEMWFTASAGPGTPNWRPYRIGFATSPDGISWTVYPNPVLEPDAGTWDETTVDHATVLRENGEYKMWYTGWSLTSPEFKIGYATSTNGIDWTKEMLHNPILGPGIAAWEDGGVGYCTVMSVPGGGYKMWYCGLNQTWVPDSGRTGYATSSDGISWQRMNNPVLTTGSTGEWDDALAVATQVLFISGSYYMWYAGNRIIWNPRHTGLAVSSNGIDWTKYDDSTTVSHPYAESDPVLSPSLGQWDGDYAEAYTVFTDNFNGDTLHMWYDGSREPTSTYLFRIGHATLPLDTLLNNFPVGIKVNDNSYIPEDYFLKQNYPNPFNPSTTIEFNLPKTSEVTLKIFNILGEEMATLISEKLPVGNYSYQWDALNLPSALYLYRLEAEGFVKTKKMILMK